MRTIAISEVTNPEIQLFYQDPLSDSGPERASYLGQEGELYKFGLLGREIKLYPEEIELYIWVDEDPLPPYTGGKKMWSYG